MQAGFRWVVLLLLMASIEVTQWYTFGGWAGLEGTPQPTHMPGALAEMARSPGPAETVHGSTCMRLSSMVALGIWISPMAAHRSKSRYPSHQLSGSCVTSYDLALEVTEFPLPPSLLVEAVRSKCQRIYSLILKSPQEPKPVFQKKGRIL